jgi:hypothetical protein
VHLHCRRKGWASTSSALERAQSSEALPLSHIRCPLATSVAIWRINVARPHTYASTTASAVIEWYGQSGYRRDGDARRCSHWREYPHLVRGAPAGTAEAPGRKAGPRVDFVRLAADQVSYFGLSFGALWPTLQRGHDVPLTRPVANKHRRRNAGRTSSSRARRMIDKLGRREAACGH